MEEWKNNVWQCPGKISDTSTTGDNEDLFSSDQNTLQTVQSSGKICSFHFHISHLFETVRSLGKFCQDKYL